MNLEEHLQLLKTDKFELLLKQKFIEKFDLQYIGKYIKIQNIGTTKDVIVFYRDENAKPWSGFIVDNEKKHNDNSLSIFLVSILLRNTSFASVIYIKFLITDIKELRAIFHISPSLKFKVNQI